MALATVIPQIYLGLNPQINLSWIDFAVAVLLPIILATILFGAAKNWLFLFGFLAYIWCLTDDAPVYLDSVFTWPEVTSGFQHIFLEYLLHFLTLFFMVLTLWQAIKTRKGKGPIGIRNLVFPLILLAVAFVTSYFQNVPLSQIQQITRNTFRSKPPWYELDIIEHIVSILFLYFAIRQVRK